MQPQQQPSDEPELFDKASVTSNMKAIGYIRTISTIVGGFSAGIFGFTGFKGFALFVIQYLLTSMAIVAFNFGGRTKIYVPQTSNLAFLVSGMGNEALAFVLYWTLMYALVHIY
ncbi:ER membrane protein complex subunit 6 [Hondaea fermentalgiana]|uniref:ER membrane protein complex subunit 6 n=1 Tax=Hondaea fermentalgiana TaxID=2315210 RepID=A0A2R5GV37_9STRA|nr:ER membrane protein complex subunit 6 [Hondaea fermentalgiana]|eukprot:GBG34722.1 ER membrane protein complex subunit 6 [Hondaea fermentalgiana]